MAACAVCEAETTAQICDKCNELLKLFDHDPELIRRAMAILQKYDRATLPDGSAELHPKTDDERR